MTPGDWAILKEEFAQKLERINSDANLRERIAKLEAGLAAAKIGDLIPLQDAVGAEDILVIKGGDFYDGTGEESRIVDHNAAIDVALACDGSR